jgi:filamentation induced by cAMP protein fic
MNDDIVPIHTTRLEDINTYRKALLSFYETSDYSEYADYFLQKKWEYLQKS